MSNYNINQFNDRIKIMNQSNAKQLIMTATEARALHNEIFGLLEQTNELKSKLLSKPMQDDLIRGEMDGGRWD